MIIRLNLNSFFVSVNGFLILSCKEAIKIKPDYHEAYNNMGVAYNRLGKYQKAIDAYKEAIKIKPDYHKAY
jgi:superkiller protein 3